MSSFFLVWNPKTQRAAYRHSTFEYAATESKRLAKANPGESFFVLQAVAVSVKHDVIFETFRPDLNDPEIPF